MFVISGFSLLEKRMKYRSRSRTVEGKTLLKALLKLIENNGEDDHEAGDYFFPEFLNTQQNESICQHAYHQGANNGSPDVAASSRERGAAEHDRCNRVQFVTFADCRMRRDQLRSGNQAGNRCAHTADHINCHFDAIHIDAGKFGGALVTTDCINLASKRRLARDKSGN